MAKKILKAYFIPQQRLSDSEKQELTDGIIIKYCKKGGLDWDGYSITAFAEENAVRGIEAEQSLYGVINQLNDNAYLTEENTMISWTDETLPDCEVFIGLIVDGSYKGYPDCRSWYRKNVLEPFVQSRMVEEWTADYDLKKHLKPKETEDLKVLMSEHPKVLLHIKKGYLSTDDVVQVRSFLQTLLLIAKMEREKEIVKMVKPLLKKFEKFLKSKG